MREVCADRPVQCVRERPAVIAAQRQSELRDIGDAIALEPGRSGRRQPRVELVLGQFGVDEAQRGVERQPLDRAQGRLDFGALDPRLAGVGEEGEGAVRAAPRYLHVAPVDLIDRRVQRQHAVEPLRLGADLVIPQAVGLIGDQCIGEPRDIVRPARAEALGRGGVNHEIAVEIIACVELVHPALGAGVDRARRADIGLGDVIADLHLAEHRLVIREAAGARGQRQRVDRLYRQFGEKGGLLHAGLDDAPRGEIERSDEIAVGIRLGDLAVGAILAIVVEDAERIADAVVEQAARDARLVDPRLERERLIEHPRQAAVDIGAIGRHLRRVARCDPDVVPARGGVGARSAQRLGIIRIAQQIPIIGRGRAGEGGVERQLVGQGKVVELEPIVVARDRFHGRIIHAERQIIIGRPVELVALVIGAGGDREIVVGGEAQHHAPAP